MKTYPMTGRNVQNFSKQFMAEWPFGVFRVLKNQKTAKQPTTLVTSPADGRSEALRLMELNPGVTYIWKHALDTNGVIPRQDMLSAIQYGARPLLVTQAPVFRNAAPDGVAISRQATKTDLVDIGLALGCNVSDDMSVITVRVLVRDQLTKLKQKGTI